MFENMGVIWKSNRHAALRDLTGRDVVETRERTGKAPAERFCAAEGEKRRGKGPKKIDDEDENAGSGSEGPWRRSFEDGRWLLAPLAARQEAEAGFGLGSLENGADILERGERSGDCGKTPVDRSFSPAPRLRSASTICLLFLPLALRRCPRSCRLRITSLRRPLGPFATWPPTTTTPSAKIAHKSQ